MEPQATYATLKAHDPCAHARCFRTADLDGLCLPCHGGNDARLCGPAPVLRPAAPVADLAALRTDVGYPGAGRERATLEQVMELERALRTRWEPA